MVVQLFFSFVFFLSRTRISSKAEMLVFSCRARPKRIRSVGRKTEMIYVGHASSICITSVFSGTDVQLRGQLNYCSNQDRDSFEITEMMRSKEKNIPNEYLVLFFFLCFCIFLLLTFRFETQRSDTYRELKFISFHLHRSSLHYIFRYSQYYLLEEN